MKALHGFSPLTAVALLVAVVVVPVVLFPFGGVLLANIVYSLGYTEYNSRKSTSLFDFTYYGSLIFSILIALIFVFFPSQDAYAMIRASSLIGPIILSSIPESTAGIFFVINVIFLLVCFNPLLVKSLKASAVYSVDYIRVHIPNRSLAALQFGYASLPIGCGFFAILVVAYFLEIPNPNSNRERPSWDGLEIVFIPATIFCCYFSMLRKSAQNELERKI